MKIVVVHPWNNRIFTSHNKVFVNIQSEITDANGLIEEHKVNLHLSDDVLESIESIEHKAMLEVEKYEAEMRK